MMPGDLTVVDGVNDSDEEPLLEKLIREKGYYNCPTYWAEHLDILLGEIECGALSKGNRVPLKILRQAVLEFAFRHLKIMGSGWALAPRVYYGHGAARGGSLQIRTYLDMVVRGGRKVIIFEEPK